VQEGGFAVLFDLGLGQRVEVGENNGPACGFAKKCRSACWRPISRSSSAMRAFALAGSSALGVADGPASAADAGSDHAPSAEGGLHPTLRPRLRLRPLNPHRPMRGAPVVTRFPTCPFCHLTI